MANRYERRLQQMQRQDEEDARCRAEKIATDAKASADKAMHSATAIQVGNILRQPTCT